MPQHLAADLHCDTAIRLARGQGLDREAGHVSLSRLRQGNIGLQVFACWVSPRYRHRQALARADQLVQAVLAEIARHPEDLSLVTDRAGWQAARRQGKVAVIIGIEGGHALDGRLENLERFHRQGVRVLTVTWNNSNQFAESAARALCACRDRGLSPLGKQLVQEANRLGVVLDLSHSSGRTFRDVLDASARPAIISHSCVKFINPHFRNLDDRQIRAAADAGWLIGVNFCPGFLGSRSPVDIHSVADQFVYIAELAGADCLALGSDFDGIESVPHGLEGPHRVPDLLEILLSRGFTKAEVRGIAGGNTLRFLGWS